MLIREEMQTLVNFCEKLFKIGENHNANHAFFSPFYKLVNISRSVGLVKIKGKGYVIGGKVKVQG